MDFSFPFSCRPLDSVITDTMETSLLFDSGRDCISAMEGVGPIPREALNRSERPAESGQ